MNKTQEKLTWVSLFPRVFIVTYSTPSIYALLVHFFPYLCPGISDAFRQRRSAVPSPNQLPKSNLAERVLEGRQSPDPESKNESERIQQNEKGATVNELAWHPQANHSQPSSESNLALIPKTRKKRWLNTFVQILNLATGTVSFSLSIANFATNGGVFYPTIYEAEAAIERTTKWIEDHRVELTKLREDYTKAYTRYTNINIHFEHYQQAASIVVSNAKHQAFEEKRTQFLNQHPNVAKFLEKGLEEFKKNGSDPHGLFITFTALNGLSLVQQGMALAGTIRMNSLTKQYQAKLDAIKNAGGDEWGTFRETRALQQQYGDKERVASKSTRARLWKGFKSFWKPKCFRSDKHLNRRIEGKLSAPTRAAKWVGRSLGVIGFVMAGVNLGFMVDGARQNRDNLNEHANHLESMKEELEDILTKLPKDMEDMNNMIDDTVRVVRYMMETKGSECAVTRENVEYVVKTMKDITTKIGNQQTKFIERNKALKNSFRLIRRYGGTQPQEIYQDLIHDNTYVGVEEDARELMKQANLEVGEWTDWTPQGTCQMKCGLKFRSVKRHCMTGTNCIGKAEDEQLCGFENYDNVTHHACVDQRKKDTVTEILGMDQVLGAVCDTTPAEYYFVKNQRFDLVLAIDMSDNSSVVLQREKSFSQGFVNQLWRKEPSDRPGYFQLVCKYFGRILEVELPTGASVEDWTIGPNSRLEGDNLFLRMASSPCQSNGVSTAKLDWSYTRDWSHSSCNQWEMRKLTEADFPQVCAMV